MAPTDECLRPTTSCESSNADRDPAERPYRHPICGYDKYVTAIIDLTPIRDGRSPARLLDMDDGGASQSAQQRRQNAIGQPDD